MICLIITVSGGGNRHILWAVNQIWVIAVINGGCVSACGEWRRPQLSKLVESWLWAKLASELFICTTRTLQNFNGTRREIPAWMQRPQHKDQKRELHLINHLYFWVWYSMFNTANYNPSYFCHMAPWSVSLAISIKHQTQQQNIHWGWTKRQTTGSPAQHSHAAAGQPPMVRSLLLICQKCIFKTTHHVEMTRQLNRMEVCIPLHHVTYFLSSEGRSPQERLLPILEAWAHSINSHLRFLLITDFSKGILNFSNTVGKYIYIFSVPLFDRSKMKYLKIKCLCFPSTLM